MDPKPNFLSKSILINKNIFPEVMAYQKNPQTLAHSNP